jgi:hypothetical protein
VTLDCVVANFSIPAWSRQRRGLSPAFKIIPKVANGMSDLFIEVFGLVPDDRIARELSIRL